MLWVPGDAKGSVIREDCFTWLVVMRPWATKTSAFFLSVVLRPSQQ